ncbi:hypothetical protein [Rhodococcus qingshengii]|uniref:hypothetical protein n=1 Tax=Rhodococcus qingshengii TaxID=334542 RepID=UPI0021AB3015|nr:hypothetical protein [Rhodococcus qingshengii]
MTAAAFTFTPDADFVDRALDAELRRDSESVDRKLRTMLAALDDSLAGISDACEELHTLYTAPGTDTAEVVSAHDQDIATHLDTPASPPSNKTPSCSSTHSAKPARSASSPTNPARQRSAPSSPNA